MNDNEIVKALELLEFCKSIARSGKDVLLTPDTIFSIDKIIKRKDKQLEAVKLMHINDVKQKDAEIERLQGDLIIERTRRENAVKACHEARKEFAERVKKRAASRTYAQIWESDLDEVLAEMEERE